MQFQTIKEYSDFFNISENIIKVFCEHNLLVDAKKIDDIWYIPRESKNILDSYLDLKELCKNLKISVVTGKNWIKLKKIIPDINDGRYIFFSKENYNNILKEIVYGNKVLKSRRNKEHISGNYIYDLYINENSYNLNIIKELLEIVSEYKIKLLEEDIFILVAECALQFLYNKNLTGSYLELYLKSEISLGVRKWLIDDFELDEKYSINFIKKYPKLFQFNYLYIKNEDTLGLIYISLKNVGKRKSTGTYYTPAKIVKKLIDNLFENEEYLNKKILDPCCGTGNFLLNLPNDINLNNIYANDIDKLSVLITRINVALKYENFDKKIFYNNFIQNNYLKSDDDLKYDIILGNPPWGYKFSEYDKQYLNKKYFLAQHNNFESFGLFIEKSLKKISKIGLISFILPESVLNVKTHYYIRKQIVDSAKIIYVNYLGNSFYKVNCPSIILKLSISAKNNKIMVERKNQNYKIENSRIIAEYFNFHTNDIENEIIKKINLNKNVIKLNKNSIFALGIVTGDNYKNIIKNKNIHNEEIIKGTDVFKYSILSSKNYINSDLNGIQQIAPMNYYREDEKLVYRFISNQLVFAYDDKKRLTLNSCNILIPKLKGLNIKYILAILNSRVSQFYFFKTYNSVKVLRHHIEDIPIMKTSEKKQLEIINIVDKLMSSINVEEKIKYYNELDEIIANIYVLSDFEYMVIKESLKNNNLFL